MRWPVCGGVIVVAGLSFRPRLHAAILRLNHTAHDFNLAEVAIANDAMPFNPFATLLRVRRSCAARSPADEL